MELRSETLLGVSDQRSRKYQKSSNAVIAVCVFYLTWCILNYRSDERMQKRKNVQEPVPKQNKNN
jgi:hypothetical protein